MKTHFQYEVISKLKKYREEKGYTQASIAKLLGISPGQLGNIESFKQGHKFTLVQILKICDTLNIDVLDIFLPERGEEVKPKELLQAIVKYQEVYKKGKSID